MARRPIPMIEFDELCYRWQQGQSLSALARALGQSRQTVRKYVRQAIQAGLTRGGSEAERREVLAVLRAGRTRDSGAGAVQQRLAPYAERIQGWLAEPHMTLKQVWRLLQEQGLGVSYPSLKRFVRRHLPPSAPRVTVRLEVSPGRQAQVDFGQVRVRFAPETGTETWHRLWVFVMTLAYSRYRFVRFVERQDLASWLDCHVRAFEFFHGVPETGLLDNLKSGVVRPDRYDPKLNRGYQELEHHYGFVVDPAPVATPKYKGKVERAIPVVRQQLVAGRVYCDLAELNTQALRWCREGVGRVAHGTTQEAPLVRFERDEQVCLKPLPATPFDPPTWAECKVHPDHHIVFERSYYSLPTRYVGQQVWVRATRRLVEVFHQDALIKTHPRAPRAGTWVTDPSDYPSRAQAFLFAHPAYCQQKAEELGLYVAQMMEQILSSHALRHLRKAQALLRLADKYGAQRLDEACRHLLAFECTELKRLKRLLEQGLPSSTASPAAAAPALSPQALSFLHPPESFTAGEGVCP